MPEHGRSADCILEVCQMCIVLFICLLQESAAVQRSKRMHSRSADCTREVTQPVYRLPRDQSTSGPELVIKGGSSILIPSSSDTNKIQIASHQRGLLCINSLFVTHKFNIRSMHCRPCLSWHPEHRELC